MTPKGWLERFKALKATGDWEALAAFRIATNQQLANADDGDTVRRFFSDVLRLGLSAERSRQMLEADLSGFRSELARSMEQVATRVKSRSDLKGVYFEFYWDGHKDDSSNSGNFFLCTSYSETEDVWGSDFDQDGYVAGVRLPDYFFFDSDREWDSESRAVAEEAANCLLLADVLRAWKAAGVTHLPLGYANHDHSMIRVHAS